MSRYIDVKLLSRQLENFAKWRAGHKDGIDFILDCSLPNTPTADVQEVKYGRWVEQVKIRKNGEPRLVYWQCSLCGGFLGTNTANFCPHCGAKMDEGEKKQ